MTSFLAENVRQFDGVEDNDYFFSRDHRLRAQYSLKLLKEVLDKNVQDKPRLLSIACSTGVIEEKIKNELGIEVFGIDAAKNSLTTAKSKDIIATYGNVSEYLPFKSETFEYVFAGEIIEHIYDTRLFLGEIHRVLKPGGYLVLTTPNLARLDDRFKLMFGKTPRQTAPMHPYLNMHIRPFTYDSLKDALNQTGFSNFNLCTNAFAIDFFGKDVRIYSSFLSHHFPTFGSTLIVRSRKEQL